MFGHHMGTVLGHMRDRYALLRGMLDVYVIEADAPGADQLEVRQRIDDAPIDLGPDEDRYHGRSLGLMNQFVPVQRAVEHRNVIIRERFPQPLLGSHHLSEYDLHIHPSARPAPLQRHVVGPDRTGKVLKASLLMIAAEPPRP